MFEERRRNILWVLPHAFFLQITVATARPTSSYLAIDLNASHLILAMIVAVFSMLPIFLAMPIGRLVDHGKATFVLLFGAAAILIAAVGLRWWTDSIAQLLVWNAVMGLGLLACLLGEHKIVAQIAGTKQERAFGLYTTATAIAHIFGPLVLGFFGGQSVVLNTQPVLLFVVAMAAALVATTFPLLARQSAEHTKERLPWTSAFDIQKPVRRGLGASIVVSMVVLTAIDLLQVYLPAIAVDRQMSVQAVSLLLMLRSMGTALSRFGLSWIMHRWGRTSVLLTSVVLAGLLMITLALPAPNFVLYTTALFLGIMLGVGQPISMAAIGLHAPRIHQGTWFAVRLTGSRIGQVILPLILTMAVGGTGAAAVLSGSGVILLAVSVTSIRPLRDLDRFSGSGSN